MSVDTRLQNTGLSYTFYPTDQDLYNRIDAMPTYDAPSRAQLKGDAVFVRAAIDFTGQNILQQTDFDSLQYIQARTGIYKDLLFRPKVFTSADCATLQGYKDAVGDKRKRLQKIIKTRNHNQTKD